MIDDRRSGQGPRDGDNTPFWLTIGVAALAGAAGVVIYQSRTRNQVGYRPPDDAPARVSRLSGPGRSVRTGRTVTIDRPRKEVYDFWRDSSNLSRFMESVRAVERAGDETRWTMAGPANRDVVVVTRTVEDVANERISWTSTEDSQIETRGTVTFRDAPAGRGTEVAVDITYHPPGGTLGRWVAKVLQAEPHLQARRDLKRLKMLLETGEIATSANRKTAA